MEKQDLINFEVDIEKEFCDGNIRAPIHLSDGNEDQLIYFFDDYINKEDIIFSTWRSHYHALLHGIPKEEVKRQIMDGHSMSINYDNPKFFSSAIVGGILPIAVGVALSIKREKGDNKVFCFIGDMTAETGIYHECQKYAENFKLPIIFVIEDNGVSVGADTKKAWGIKGSNMRFIQKDTIKGYSYKKEKYPHVGAKKFITF